VVWRSTSQDAALIPAGRHGCGGIAAIRDSLRGSSTAGAGSRSIPKLVLRVGELAFLANRWSLTGGTRPDGSVAELGATTADVARRQPDGGSRLYVIDNARGRPGSHLSDLRAAQRVVLDHALDATVASSSWPAWWRCWCGHVDAGVAS
jgi:ketosteroid isomerase-like protein